MSDSARRPDPELRRDESDVPRRPDPELRRDESDVPRQPDPELRRDESDVPRRSDPEPGRDQSKTTRQPGVARPHVSRSPGEAQRRVNRIRAFRAELDALMAAGVTRLSAEQHAEISRFHDQVLQQLAAEHDIDRSEAAGRLSRGMRIASFIAAIALTAAVYSFVQRFWGGFDLPLQATLLCAFTLVALAGVELSAQRERTLYIASIFALVAFGSYWLAVFVLSDLLNVPVTPPALWGGALFGVALALPYGFRVIFGAALLAMLVALAASVFQAAGMPWTLVPEFPEIITAAAFLLAVTASKIEVAQPSFAAVTRGVALAVGFIGLLFLSSAGQASLLPTSSRATEFIYQGIFLLAAVVVLVRGVQRQWLEAVYIASGALTVFIFVRFADWFWDVLPRFVFFLVLAAVAFGWLLALRRMRARLERG